MKQLGKRFYRLQGALIESKKKKMIWMYIYFSRFLASATLGFAGWGNIHNYLNFLWNSPSFSLFLVLSFEESVSAKYNRNFHFLWFYVLLYCLCLCFIEFVSSAKYRCSEWIWRFHLDNVSWWNEAFERSVYQYDYDSLFVKIFIEMFILAILLMECSNYYSFFLWDEFHVFWK